MPIYESRRKRKRSIFHPYNERLDKNSIKGDKVSLYSRQDEWKEVIENYSITSLVLITVALDSF